MYERLVIWASGLSSRVLNIHGDALRKITLDFTLSVLLHTRKRTRTQGSTTLAPPLARCCFHRLRSSNVRSLAPTYVLYVRTYVPSRFSPLRKIFRTSFEHRLGVYRFMYRLSGWSAALWSTCIDGFWIWCDVIKMWPYLYDGLNCKCWTKHWIGTIFIIPKFGGKCNFSCL